MNHYYGTSLASVVDSLISKNDNKPNYLSVFYNWNSIVGDDFAKISTPYKVTVIGTKRVLILKAKKGFALELQHESHSILNKIHNFLGNNSFDRIKIIQMDVNKQLGDCL